MEIHLFAIICYICLECLCSRDVAMATDSLDFSQSITGNETLISSGNKFELGFFNLSSSSKVYLGIWYNQIPTRTYVWIANRENPLNDTSGALRIGNDGNLILLDEAERIIWSTSVENPSSRNTSVQLADSGNLVLRDRKVDGSVLWQSFDHPSHATVAGMKFGWNSRTGLNGNRTSWKSSEDPSPGEYTYGYDLRGLPQIIIWKGASKKFRSGPWNGVSFGGAVFHDSFPFNLESVVNSEDGYYIFSPKNRSSLVMEEISYSGKVRFLSWDYSIDDWQVIYEFPQDICGDYGRCGPNSICSVSNAELHCDCLIGYNPSNTQEWSVRDWSDGCRRNYPLNCSEGEGFVEVDNVKMPDLLQLWPNTSISLEECKAICLANCSCTAYANSDVTGTGRGCLLWFNDLIDLRQLTSPANQKLYIRVTASDLESEPKRRDNTVVVIVATITASILLLVVVLFLIWKRKSYQRGRRNQSRHTDKDNHELPYFDFTTIARATQDFSDGNKIGEGGFGSVYKGVLFNGQYIAVKRLSENSSQGLDEYKNEVMLIAKLQHRNLVRLLGCCIQEEERILIYEYMTNGSLDSYIFGGLNYDKRRVVAWTKRFSIIVGIARGLLYLHRDSRLTIIHRDLKASNVLLDDEMNPKISDFGIARTFREEQPSTKTKRVVGTFGYMSPEYATRGIFSIKSDVFSFGVLVLEIVSGERISRFQHGDHDLTLLGYAWKLWEEGRSSELINSFMEDSFPISEALRCIQIGLLCVQERPKDRPLMSSVLSMLDSEIAVLPRPTQPGFSVSFYDVNTTEGERVGISNEMTDTIIEGR